MEDSRSQGFLFAFKGFRISFLVEVYRAERGDTSELLDSQNVVFLGHTDRCANMGVSSAGCADASNREDWYDIPFNA